MLGPEQYTGGLGIDISPCRVYIISRPSFGHLCSEPQKIGPEIIPCRETVTCTQSYEHVFIFIQEV